MVGGKESSGRNYARGIDLRIEDAKNTPACRLEPNCAGFEFRGAGTHQNAWDIANCGQDEFTGEPKQPCSDSEGVFKGTIH